MRSTIAEISKSKVRHNINQIKKFAPDSTILAIVKANAYGHGIVGFAKILREEGIEFLGVAFTNEAVEIRQSGDTQPIIVLVPSLPDEADVYCDFNLQPVASSLDFVYALNKEAEKRNIIIQTHLFIGTGMNREGIQPDDAIFFMDECKKMKHVEVIGACTHFASSSTDAAFVEHQLNRFNETLKKLENSGFTFKYLHAANSAAIVNHPDSLFNMVRPGTALYGYPPDPKINGRFNLKPVLELKSKVILSRRVKIGESVSYDRLFTADKPTNIVTIPIGYGDGYFKRLTNIGECLIKGKRYKIVGAVCMDEVMADVGDDEINPGDEVVFIGQQGNETISAYDIAEKVGTIHYEVLTSISARVPKVYVE
jgi:alanine racemase